MLNKVILMGRVTADIELKNTTGGVAVTSFSVAVERNFADKDGKRLADFINIVAWRGTAVFIAKYFKKGQMIAIDGYIQTRKYEDKQGNSRTAFEVVAEQAYFADSKKADTPHDSPPDSQEGFNPEDFEEIDVPEDELPFH